MSKLVINEINDRATAEGPNNHSLTHSQTVSRRSHTKLALRIRRCMIPDARVSLSSHRRYAMLCYPSALMN
ncbi:hypothetical protein E4T56_gene13106 [Termitomyces sp. T112]|nr:hypothetical protein E4T56_gene13106 [Termitomyces sp. T112]